MPIFWSFLRIIIVGHNEVSCNLCPNPWER